jgi:hypothetical protein
MLHLHKLRFNKRLRTILAKVTDGSSPQIACRYSWGVRVRASGAVRAEVLTHSFHLGPGRRRGALRRHALEGDHAWRQDVVHRQGERASAGERGHGGGWRGWFEAVHDQRLGTCGISSLPMRMYGVMGTRGSGG